MNIKQDGISPNAGRLLWAGFMAILAAGIGFGVRGGILANWGAEFGFTGAELGDIGGAGLTGFCFGIIIGGVIVDKIGYGKLVIAAFAFHVLSAFVTFAASPDQSKMVVYNFLYWGTFIFAFANGTLEAVANPLVATLFPNNRTHYLNILHASWPAGLVLGGAIGWYLGENVGWHWKTQLGLFLVPTAVYGLMFFGQHMPKSEASQKGLKLGEMFKDVGLLGGAVACVLIALFVKSAFGPMLAFFTGVEFFSGSSFWWVALAVGGALWAAVGAITRGSLGHWLLFVLFIAHALIGAVELGTDGWVQNITGNILTPAEGKILFVFTSAIMFSLRFCADFIEKKIGLSPIGILLACSVLAVVGLLLTSRIETFAGAMFALAVYAVGKTFFWPTMLAVAGDRFPRTGAIAMSIMGGIGMMSAGMLGFPGLGYAKDRFTSEALAQTSPAVYAEYKVEQPKAWLFFKPVAAIDGRKLGEVQGNLAKLRGELTSAGIKDPKAAVEQLPADQKAVFEASIQGDRKTLKADAFIPAAMAVIYLLILLYFKAIGGYKPVHIVPLEEQAKAAK
ncbi:MAG: MFS transporter [Verrucomicrobia bacterium]|nr:MFS transporter [Verrucomicrobiota bacterium]